MGSFVRYKKSNNSHQLFILTKNIISFYDLQIILIEKVWSYNTCVFIVFYSGTVNYLSLGQLMPYKTAKLKISDWDCYYRHRHIGMIVWTINSLYVLELFCSILRSVIYVSQKVYSNIAFIFIFPLQNRSVSVQSSYPV